MSKKIIRLTESQLEAVIKLIVEEEDNKLDPYDRLIKGVKPDPNGEYCFTRNGINQIYKSMGYNDIAGFKIDHRFHVIKRGDTYGELDDQGMASNIKMLNDVKQCPELGKKQLKAGNVLLLSKRPGR